MKCSLRATSAGVPKTPSPTLRHEFSSMIQLKGLIGGEVLHQHVRIILRVAIQVLLENRRWGRGQAIRGCGPNTGRYHDETDHGYQPSSARVPTAIYRNDRKAFYWTTSTERKNNMVEKEMSKTP